MSKEAIIKEFKEEFLDKGGWKAEDAVSFLSSSLDEYEKELKIDLLKRLDDKLIWNGEKWTIREQEIHSLWDKWENPMTRKKIKDSLTEEKECFLCLQGSPREWHVCQKGK